MNLPVPLAIGVAAVATIGYFLPMDGDIQENESERNSNRNARIFICDGNEVQATEMAAQLESLGYLARRSAAPDELFLDGAVDALDLLILGAKPAGRDGVEVCRQLRATPTTRHLPVIFLLDGRDGELTKRAREAGVNEFLERPVHARELASRVRRVLGLNAISAIYQTPAMPAEVETSAAPEGSGFEILLADDDKASRRALELRLVKLGYGVRTADNGRLALDAIKAALPDLVIMDIMMPELDGLAACRRIKEDQRTEKIPVVMLTALDDEEAKREGYQSGADDYLVKPVEFAELAVRLRTMLQIRALRAVERPRPSRGTDDESVADRLAEWHRWHELCNSSAEIRSIRERVERKVQEYMSGWHEYKPEVFLSLDTPPAEMKRAYDEIRKATRDKVREAVLQEPPSLRGVLPKNGQEMIIREMVNERFAFGPIQPLVDDPRITDILVSRYNDIHVEMNGRLVKSPIRFQDEEHMRRIMAVVLRFSGKEVNESTPYVEARLRDGSRVSATVPPLSIDGATLTIRKFVVKRLGLEDLICANTLNMEMAECLSLFVRAGLNIIVSGSTGAGKTTLLNVLGSCVPINERIITVEDTAELQIRHSDIVPELMGRAGADSTVPAMNMERFEARASRIENLEISIRDIIRLALRKRPDRIIVGEVRGAEALDMLNAMNTGHKGCLTTIHANNTRDLMVRLENMVIEANPAIPLAAVQRMIVAALNIAVQVVKFADNTRRIIEVMEIEGFDERTNQIVLRRLFTYEPGRPDPYVFCEAPSERISGLVSEYLMKIGKYRRNWNVIGDEATMIGILKAFLRRTASLWLRSEMMAGASPEEKDRNLEEVLDWLVEEVHGPEKVVTVRRSDTGETVALPVRAVFPGRCLRDLEEAARLKLAKRLDLRDDALSALVTPEPVPPSVWKRIFPLERPVVPDSQFVPAPPGEGMTQEDVRSAFFNALTEQVRELERNWPWSDAPGGHPSLRATASYLPYLAMAEATRPKEIKSVRVERVEEKVAVQFVQDMPSLRDLVRDRRKE